MKTFAVDAKFCTCNLKDNIKVGLIKERKQEYGI